MLLRSTPQLRDDVETYLSFGDHRAGTLAEQRTADWVSERLAHLGYVVERQTFPIRTLLDPAGRLTSGDVAVDVFPQWLPPTSALGRSFVAPLLPLAAPAGIRSIRIMTSPIVARGNWGSAQQAWVNDAIAKNAIALVIAPDGGTGDVYVANQHDLAPFQIPVGLVA